MRIACGTALNHDVVWMMKKAKAISDRMTTSGCLMNDSHASQASGPFASRNRPSISSHM